MKKKNDLNPMNAIYTDIQWIKTSLSEIKDNIKSLNEMHREYQERLTVVETKVAFHDKFMYAVLGATVTGFISIVIWILSVI